MSAQDEVSVVVKCLRLGAADYLMKPLRTNELLNIWTHMWRRRRMVDMKNSYSLMLLLMCFTLKVRANIYSCIIFCQLGMIEKDVFLHDFEMPTSEPTDANTNSTTPISDDTYDTLNVVSNLELSISNHPECEVRCGTFTH